MIITGYFDSTGETASSIPMTFNLLNPCSTAIITSNPSFMATTIYYTLFSDTKTIYITNFTSDWPNIVCGYFTYTFYGLTSSNHIDTNVFNIS